MNDAIRCQLLKVYHTVEGRSESVIDVHELVSVTVANKTFPLPSIVDSQD